MTAETGNNELQDCLLPEAVRFEDTVASVIKTCPPDTVFLAAVSGGADSMAMLSALHAIFSNAESSRLNVIHIEHGIRPAQESEGDAVFVGSFCKSNGINCHIVHITPGKIVSYAKKKGCGIEAAARFFRHRELLRHAKKLGSSSRILIAHSRNDALELSLMRVLRGAGPAGLSFMPVNSGRILRPLLCIDRKSIIAYLNEKGIIWREDATNTGDKFLRSRIRSRLIPLLNEYFSSWQTGLAGMAETQSLTAQFLEDEAKKRIVWQPLSCTENSGIHSDLANFFAQPQIIREEALYRGINICSLNYCESGSKIRNKSIKRSVIRKFCGGLITSADLGLIHINLKDGNIVLRPKKSKFFERGKSVELVPET